LLILHHHRQQRRSAPVRSAPPFSATPCLSLRRGRSHATGGATGSRATASPTGLRSLRI